jgi:hypothetical protein
MKAATPQPDLFAPPQPGLFDEAPPPSAVNPEDIRRIVRPRLAALMQAVTTAAALPWSPRDAKTNAILFCQMANWLPADERGSQRAAFRAEYERLGALDCTHPPERPTSS